MPRIGFLAYPLAGCLWTRVTVAGAPNPKLQGGFLLGDYLKFNKMITPILIQWFFWVFVAITVIGGLLAIALVDGAGRFSGVVIIIFGPILLRICAEIALVLFKINEHLGEIRNRL